MDAFELLKEDHKKVSALFKEIDAATEQNKRRIFNQLKNELEVHARIEEQIFYPALEETPAARDITLEAYEEHKIIKELLADLASSGVPKDEWDAKLSVLKENVEHHVQEEEGELFDKAEDALSDDEIERLGDEMAAAKGRAVNGTPRSESASVGQKGKSKSGNTSSKSSKSDGESRGILGTLANLVGLGGSSKKKDGPKRSSGSTKSSDTRKKTQATGTKKAAAKKTTKKAAPRKSSRQTSTSKRSGKGMASTRSSASKAGRKGKSAGTSKKRSSASTKKSASKRAAKRTTGSRRGR